MSEFNLPTLGDSLEAERTANDLLQNTTEHEKNETIGEYYDRMLDPEDKLPTLQIVEIQTSPINSQLNILDDKGDEIGIVQLDLGKSKKRKWALIDIDMEAKGYGKAVYKQVLQLAAEKGLLLHSRDYLSRGTKPIWDWLVECGVAEKLSESEVNEDADWYNYSQDQYQALPLPDSVRPKDKNE